MSSGTLRPLRLVRSLRLLRRISDAPESLVAAAAVLAVAETVARGGSRHVSLPVALLLCLCTTLPLGLQRTYPAAAAVAASAATLLSLVPFQSLTVSGLAVQLAVLYRLGRAGSRRLTVLLVLPFVALALSGPPHAGTGVRVLSVLLASLASAAAGAGLAHRARSEALEHTAAQRVIADTLLAHAARGERARIARELHDVVAHHISMIAVQAETARLTTPGLPTAGAQRLLSIGDTARAALTEMRRLLGVLREDAGTQGPDRRPQPGLPSSSNSSTRPATPPAPAPASSSTAPSPRSTPASNSPPTASSRKPSPTPAATHRARRWTWNCVTATRR